MAHEADLFRRWCGWETVLDRIRLEANDHADLSGSPDVHPFYASDAAVVHPVQEMCCPDPHFTTPSLSALHTADRSPLLTIG